MSGSAALAAAIRRRSASTNENIIQNTQKQSPPVKNTPQQITPQKLLLNHDATINELKKEIQELKKREEESEKNNHLFKNDILEHIEDLKDTFLKMNKLLIENNIDIIELKKNNGSSQEDFFSQMLEKEPKQEVIVEEEETELENEITLTEDLQETLLNIPVD